MRARRSTNVPDGRVCAARTALIPISHRLPPGGYDEPDGLSCAISSICPVSADGEQLPACSTLIREAGIRKALTGTKA